MASNDTLRQLLHLSNHTVTASFPLAGVAMGETAAAAAAAAAVAEVHTALNANTTLARTTPAAATTMTSAAAAAAAAVASVTNATLGPLVASTVSVLRTSTLLDNFTTTVSTYLCSPPGKLGKVRYFSS